jgi:hypothetical protein
MRNMAHAALVLGLFALCLFALMNGHDGFAWLCGILGTMLLL